MDLSARWMRLSLCPFSLCLSAFFSLNVAPSVWLTAWLCSCWQLRLLPQDNIAPPHLSLHLSNHPSLPRFSFLLPILSSSQLLLLSFLLLLINSPLLALPWFVSCPLSPLPFSSSSLQWRHQPSGPIYLCVRQQLERHGSQMPAMSPSYTHTHTHPQRLCPDKTAREQITP